MPRRAVPLPWS
ncbi:RTX protein, partial [Vibrio cholerae HC-78A1]